MDETSDASPPDDPVPEAEFESETLKVPAMDFRRLSTLEESDEKHDWLSEVEKIGESLDAAFLSDYQYVAVSNYVQRYLDELEKHESMKYVRIEFSDLFQKFRALFAGATQLKNKVQELKGQTKVTNDENRELKGELEAKNEEIEKLQTNLENLEKTILEMGKEKSDFQRMFADYKETMASWRKAEETDKRVPQDVEEAQIQINDLQEKLDLVRKELDLSNQKSSLRQNKIEELLSEKATLQKELNSAKYEMQKQITRAEKGETIILELTDDLNNKIATNKTLIKEAKQMNFDLVRLKEEVKRLFQNYRKCQKDIDSYVQTDKKLRRDVNVREDRIKLLITQRDSIEIDLTNKQTEVFALKGDIQVLKKDKNSLLRRASVLQERCVDAESKLESAKNENNTLQKEFDLITKELQVSADKNRELTKQKDTLSEEAKKLQKKITELQGEIKTELEISRNLEKHLEESQKFAKGLSDNIKKLEQENKNLTRKVSDALTYASELKAEIMRHELIISGLKKNEKELRQSLAAEQNKFERLAEDERHFRKLLSECTHEVEQLRRQEVLLKRHIEQLQGLNQGFNDQCKKLNARVNNLSEELGNMKENRRQQAKKIEGLNANLKHRDDQEKLLLKDVARMEDLVSASNCKIQTLMEEKNIQNSKLNEKDEEISLLNENICSLQVENATMDQSLNERIDDINLLKLRITQMARTNAQMNVQVEHLGATRQELVNTHKDLLDEKVKSKVLEEEVQKPVNLHRWRILEGSDPERGQLIAKNQALQKQLSQKMKQLDSKEGELQEKAKLSQELQEQVRRLSGAGNVQEQLLACKRELSKRMDRVKILTAENYMFETLCSKYKTENVALKEALKEFKIKQFEQKRKKKNEAS